MKKITKILLICGLSISTSFVCTTLFAQDDVEMELEYEMGELENEMEGEESPSMDAAQAEAPESFNAPPAPPSREDIVGTQAEEVAPLPESDYDPVSSTEVAETEPEEAPAVVEERPLVDEVQKSVSPKVVYNKDKKRKKRRLKRRISKRKKSYNKRPTSATFKGFKRLKKNCSMYSTTDKASRKVLRLKRGKKLWLESEGMWFKGFRRKGVGYIPASCF